MHCYQEHNIDSVAFSVLLHHTCHWHHETGLYVTRYLFQILTKSGFSPIDFWAPSIKFHQNLSSGSHGDVCGQQDKHDMASTRLSLFSQTCLKIDILWQGQHTYLSISAGICWLHNYIPWYSTVPWEAEGPGCHSMLTNTSLFIKYIS
jgi:hypothetical protein